MSIIDDFAVFRDQYGLVGLDPASGSDNGALFTTEYAICLAEERVDPSARLAEVSRLIGAMAKLETLPGLTSRTPVNHSQNSMDNVGAYLTFMGCFSGISNFADRMVRWGWIVNCQGFGTTPTQYVALAYLNTVLSLILRPWWIWQFLKDGCKPKLFWNNDQCLTLTLDSWFGRSPGLMGFTDLVAYGYTTPLRWLGVLVGQFLGAFRPVTDYDARKLPYVNWYFLTKRTGWAQRWFWKLAYRLWVFVLMKKYPNGMRDVYAGYYKNLHHPILTYSKPYFKV